MELLPSRLTDRADRYRALRLIRAKVGSHHFEFRRHIGVRSDVEGGGAGTVRREAPDWTRAGALIVSSIRTLVHHATCKGHAGHNLDELGGILTYDGDVLKDVFVDEG